MFERWTKRRNESVDRDSYVAQAAARRGASFSHIIRKMIETGQAEGALEVIRGAKAAESARRSPAVEPDEKVRAETEDLLQFLDELEEGVKRTIASKIT